MFNIGPEEILLILVIALVFLGPKRLPEVARQIGKGLREFRNLTGTAREELMRNVSLDEDDEPIPSQELKPAEPGDASSNGSSKPKKSKKKKKAEDAPSGVAAEADTDAASPDVSAQAEPVESEPAAADATQAVADPPVHQDAGPAETASPAEPSNTEADIDPAEQSG